MNQDLLSLTFRLMERLLPWAGIFVNMAGAVVAATSIRRSRWMVLVFLAFAVETALQLGFRVVVPMLAAGSDPMRVQTFMVLSNVIGTLEQAALVVGLAGALSDWARSARTSAAPRS